MLLKYECGQILDLDARVNTKTYIKRSQPLNYESNSLLKDISNLKKEKATTNTYQI